MINKKNNVKGSGKQPKMFTVRDIIPMISKKLNLSGSQKKKKNGGKKKPGAISKIARSIMPSGTLSACALKYALACTDPFDPNAQGACIPSFPALDSHKTHGFVRIDGQIGTLGVGWIVVAPTLANNTPIAFYTNSSFTLADTTVLSGPNVLQTGVSPAFMGNLPYAASDLVHTVSTNNPAVAGRIVSCGVSIQYTGTTLNESGLSYCYRSPSHVNVVAKTGGQNATETSDLSQFIEVGIESFDRMRCEVVDFATSSNETGYSGANELSLDGEVGTVCCYPYTQGNQHQNNQRSVSYNSVAVGCPTMVIMVTGVAGQSFHCDVICHVEYIGRKAASSATPSHADPVGFQHVLTALQNIQTMKTANPKMTNWSAFYAAFKGVVKAAKPLAVPAAKAALASLLA